MARDRHGSIVLRGNIHLLRWNGWSPWAGRRGCWRCARRVPGRGTGPGCRRWRRGRPAAPTPPSRRPPSSRRPTPSGHLADTSFKKNKNKNKLAQRSAECGNKTLQPEVKLKLVFFLLGGVSNNLVNSVIKKSEKKTLEVMKKSDKSS